MTGTVLVVTATPAPDKQSDLTEYLTGVMPLLQAAGGQLIGRYRIGEAINGNGDFAMLMTMRFENAETVRDLFASDTYKALIKVRDSGFSKVDISIADEID